MAVLYSIRDWDKHFENAQSKRATRTSWVPTPNKHDGKSFRRMMQLPDGEAIYGCWHLILQVASKMPRRGVLADADGPLTAEDIAVKTGSKPTAIQRALDVCSSHSIGWIDAAGDAPSPLGVVSECSQPELNGIELKGRERTEEKYPPNPPRGGAAPPRVAATQVSKSNSDRPDDSAAEIVRAWNACESFCKVQPPIRGKRERALRQRLREPQWRENWANALALARASPFCCGENDRGWRATFDWFVRQETVTKLIEGQYSSNGRRGGNHEGLRDFLKGEGYDPG